MGGRRSHRLAEHAELVRRLVAAEPDLTLEELRRRLADEGIVIGRSSIDRYLTALGLTRKKRRSHAAEQARPDVARARAAWRPDQPGMSPGRLVFVDETWAKTNMARRYGRAPRGQRLVAAVPHGHWKTSTFLAGLRQDGITAPCVLDGPINGRFPASPCWLGFEQFLAPTLQPGDVVVLDNLNSHKVAGVREAIEARGATVRYLPPYSPDLNPSSARRRMIRPSKKRRSADRRGEQTFAKLKAGLRKAAARCRDDLWDAIGLVLDTITPKRMPQLPRPCRICFHMNGRCSRSRIGDHERRRSCCCQGAAGPQRSCTMARKSAVETSPKVHVLVTVDDGHKGALDEVARQLGSVGMNVGDLFPLGGVIAGEVASADLGKLKQIAGVASVEEEPGFSVA